MLALHSTWSLPALTVLLGGFLCLDESSAVQTWLSQPLPAAVLTGLIWGHAEIGLAIGFPLQMIFIGNLPVGQSFVGDPVTAVVGVTAAACRAGIDGVALPLGEHSSALALWGWLVLGAGLLSLAGHWLVRAERVAFGLWMHEGRKSLRDGNLVRLEHLHLRCLATTFLRGATITAVYLLLIQNVWIPFFQSLGRPFLLALAWLPFLLPGLGVGALLEQYGWRRCWWWCAAGVVLTVLLKWSMF